MTISPTILIIAALIVVTLIVVAVSEIRELSSENETLRRELAAYIMAFGEVDDTAQKMSKKIDDEMKTPPSAAALEKRKWRAERAMIVSPNGTKRYVPVYMCDRVPSDKRCGSYKWVLKPDYCPEVASGDIEINPRTNKPYKTSKAHRDAMKRYQAKRKAEMK